MKKSILTPLLLLLSIFLSGCEKESPNPVSKEGFYFDTVISISIYSPINESSDEVLSGALDLCEKYEDMFSSSKENSEISLINTSSDPIKVSPDCINLLEKGIEYGKISNGAFDITMGNVIKLWDIGKNPKIPGEDELKNTLSHVSYENIIIDNDMVTLSDKNASIDLGGIAKGFISDKIKEYLREKGVESAIIFLGGNVDAIGKKPDGSDFKIGIQNPFTEDSNPIITLSVNNKSVVTSGTYQRFFEKDGVIYHHILDSHTGYPCDNGIASVTIVSSSSTDADALSTTVFLLSPKEGMELVNRTEDTEAFIIKDDGEILYSTGAKDYILE